MIRQGRIAPDAFSNCNVIFTIYIDIEFTVFPSHYYSALSLPLALVKLLPFFVLILEYLVQCPMLMTECDTYNKELIVKI